MCLGLPFPTCASVGDVGFWKRYTLWVLLFVGLAIMIFVIAYLTGLYGIKG
jgi:hypothetical protein